MSPTGPLFPTTASSGSGANTAWTNPTNAEASDAVYATATLSASSTNNLLVSGYGFNLPSTAVIDGIFVEIERYGTGVSTKNVQLQKAGSLAGTAKAGIDAWSPANHYFGYGSPTDLWGTTWSTSDINNSGFGAAVSAIGTGTASVDAVRITVYWHTPPTSVFKEYYYKVANNLGIPLGLLPIPSSDLKFSQDINTGGSQTTIIIPVSADTSALPVDVLTDEAGNILTDENSNTLTDEGKIPLFLPGSSSQNALIKNGNTIQIVVVNYWHPNGKVIFNGIMENCEATFGGDSQDDSITIIAYGDGEDLQNYMLLTAPTLDQSQTSYNSNFLINAAQTIPQVGQAISPGAGVTGIDRITLKLAAVIANNPAVTVSIYASGSGVSNLARAAANAVPDATASQLITSTSALNYDFVFNYNFPGTPPAYYVVMVTCIDANGVNVSYQNTSVYADSMVTQANITGDLYFQTYTPTTDTKPTFTSEDPSNMLLNALGSYNGGIIKYSNSSIKATGLSLTALFTTSTIYEAIQEVLTLSPSGFYFYVDLGTDIFYFLQASVTADIVLTKGLHMNQIKLISTIEYVINTVFFTGALVSGANIYTYDQSASSVANYRTRLDRPTDSHVLDTTTAHTVAKSEITQNKGEQYQTVVTVLDTVIDIYSLHVGQVVGFNGFGTFADSILAQIVRIDYEAEQATLTLGLIPKRQTNVVETLTKGLIALNTINNPTTPS